MRKHLFSFCVIMALFMMIGCATLQNLIGQSKLETYTFNYDGKEYSALLPKEVSMPSEFAEVKPFCWSWIGPLCVMHVRYVALQDFPQSSFWFTEEHGVLALVYHTKTNAQAKHTPYIYIKGLPVEISPDKLQAKIEEWSIIPK